MYKLVSSAVALLSLSASLVDAVPAIKQAGAIIPGSYLVALKESSTEQTFESLMMDIQSNLKEDGDSSMAYVYNMGEEFRGFAGDFSDSFLKSLEEKGIFKIEPNRILSINKIQEGPENWGLSRLSSNQSEPDFSKYDYPNEAGEGVMAYVLDTGCNPDHEEFEGRAKLGQAFGSDTSKDGHGHGTHVAGTIVGKVHGVAKKANVTCVKVLADDGSGSLSDVVAGIEYVVKEASGKKSVANMSLGGRKSSILDDAVDAAIKAGVTFVVAAGNANDDACETSPANVPAAITVAASDKGNAPADFSNYGECVDVYGPGVKIKSAWFDGQYKTISGTSMASPHVCGVAAVYLSINGTMTPAQVHDAIKQRGTKNVIKDVPDKTPNVMAYIRY